jgi:PadR family transcriptional regulator, regulatory protein PadR
MAQRKICVRHDEGYPCSCGMGNLYRFVEPVVLLLLREKGRSCGYNLCSDLQDRALTDAEIDKAALYRTLRNLEKNGNVKSAWETGDGGPARRVYRLTKEGENHLEEWTVVLEHLSKSMTRFVRQVRNERRPSARKSAKSA